MGFTESVCDRVLFMDEGGGEECPPEIIFKHPKHERTRNFLRKHLTV
jgi:polar amino acid transport system ATP-binding protein